MLMSILGSRPARRVYLVIEPLIVHVLSSLVSTEKLRKARGR